MRREAVVDLGNSRGAKGSIKVVAHRAAVVGLNSSCGAVGGSKCGASGRAVVDFV